jgi:hypothetical protein
VSVRNTSITQHSGPVTRVSKIIFAVIEIAFYAVETSILFVAAAIISLIIIIVTPFTLFTKGADTAAMRSRIIAPLDLARKNSVGRWGNLLERLP